MKDRSLNPLSSMATGCAVDAYGNLKDAADMEFFESETDMHPLSGPATGTSSAS